MGPALRGLLWVLVATEIFALPSDWFSCTDGPNNRCIYNEPNPFEPMPINLTLAFFGDQGLDPPPYTSGPRIDLMSHLKNEDGVSAFFHAGDFDYGSNPDGWDAMISSALGADFPYFAAAGNHDLSRWGDYATKIKGRWERMGAKCWGDVGIGTVCSFRGFTFILSGAGNQGFDPYGTDLIRKGFWNYGGIWRMCLWHKNQHLLQLGDKPDEVGWDYYTYCLKNGAMIINGHEHSYSRSKEITAFDPAAPIYNEASPIVVGPNSTFVAVSGVAGMDVRVCTQGKENNPWWGKTLCQPSFNTFGALVCVFNLNGNERDAYCYFKTTNREVLDSFYVLSHNNIDSYLNRTEPPNYNLDTKAGTIIGCLCLLLLIVGCIRLFRTPTSTIRYQ